MITMADIDTDLFSPLKKPASAVLIFMPEPVVSNDMFSPI